MSSSTDTPNAHEEFLTAFKNVFKEYLEQEKSSASLKNFHLYNPEYIVTHSSKRDVKITWNRVFKAAIEEFQVEEYNKQQPPWDDIFQELLDRPAPHSTLPGEVSHPKSLSTTPGKNTEVHCPSGSSGSSGSSSITGHDLLSPQQWEIFEEKYEAMDDDSKWRLGDVFVEDVMYKYAKTLKYENAAHSFILNLADKSWQKVFSEDQLREIENDRALPLPTLPKELTEFLNKFKNVNNLDDAWKVANESQFDPVREFDADCAKRTILNVVAAYRWDAIDRIGRNGEERDVMHLWRAIDDSFDDLKADIFRSDQQSSSRRNEERDSTDGSIKQEILGTKPDLIISKNMVEFAIAEQGYSDDAGCGAKEHGERHLKLPKNLKKMLLNIGRHLGNDVKAIRSIRTVGFSHTHLRMKGLIMDAPRGYVCRIRELKEVAIPCEFERFWKTYIQFLKHVYILKYIVKDCMNIVKNGPSIGEDDDVKGDNEEEDNEIFTSVIEKHKNTLYIPSCLNRIGDNANKAPKKRQITEVDGSI